MIQKHGDDDDILLKNQNFKRSRCCEFHNEIYAILQHADDTLDIWTSQVGQPVNPADANFDGGAGNDLLYHQYNTWYGDMNAVDFE